MPIMSTCERRQAGCVPDLRQDFRAGGGFKADVGMVERHVPRCLAMRYSVHQAVEVGDGRRQGRGTGRQAEALQDFCSCVGRLNCGDNFHPAAATFAQNIHQEGSVFINSAHV